MFNPINNTSDFLSIEIKSLNEQVKGQRDSLRRIAAIHARKAWWQQHESAPGGHIFFHSYDAERNQKVGSGYQISGSNMVTRLLCSKHPSTLNLQCINCMLLETAKTIAQCIEDHEVMI